LGKPGCAKCKRAGVECPGYGKQKPLQWLEVGRVKCREKKKQPRVAESGALEEFEDVDEPEASESTIRASPKGKERAHEPVAQLPKAKVQLEVEADVDVFEEGIPRLGIEDETTDIVQAVFYCEFPA
jgi:hypothetical protein